MANDKYMFKKGLFKPRRECQSKIMSINVYSYTHLLGTDIEASFVYNWLWSPFKSVRVNWYIKYATHTSYSPANTVWVIELKMEMTIILPLLHSLVVNAYQFEHTIPCDYNHNILRLYDDFLFHIHSQVI